MDREELITMIVQLLEDAPYVTLVFIVHFLKRED